MRSFKIWLAAARPRTLPAALAPVLMGTALAVADDAFHGLAACAALLGAVLIQIGANYANDYFDHVKGADTSERQGPTRATQAGLVRPDQMRLATLLILALSVLPGLYLVYRGGWPILAIGVASILLALLYTGGPLPLGYIGVADLFVLVFFGPVAVAGTYYVQAQTLRAAPVLAGLLPGLLSTAILTVNNLRDIDQDRAAGKRTLAVRFGANFARWEYLVAVVAALLVLPPILAFSEGTRNAGLFALTVILLTPYAALRIRTVFTHRDGPTLNACLADTGKLLLAVSLLFAGVWIVFH